MKNKALKYAIILQAVLIVLLAAYIDWINAGKAGSLSSGVSKAASQPGDVSLTIGQIEGNKPVVIDIPMLEDGRIYEYENNDVEIMRDCLNRRLSGAGLQLSDRYLDLVCGELGSELFVSAYGLQWVQYKSFGILALKPLTTEREGGTCYVFENNRYKGYIAHWGYLDTAACFAELDDELWLTVSSYGHGSGFSCTDYAWYRLTSMGLDCELRYTGSLHKNPIGVLQVNYSETFVKFTKNDYGDIYVVTKWREEVEDGGTGDIYHFQHEGEASHLLNANRLWETYEMGKSHDYMSYLTDYRAEFEALIQNGGPAQKEAVQLFLQTVLEKEELEALSGISGIAQWYEERRAAQLQADLITVRKNER